MKNLLFLIALFLITSCSNCEFELKKNTMIKPSIFNAINFSDDFNRESKYFDPSLQRVKPIVSSSNTNCYLTFFFKPTVMPEGADPEASLWFYFDDVSYNTEMAATTTVKLTDGYIYYFKPHPTYFISGNMRCMLTIAGYDDVIFSEWCEFVSMADLSENAIIEIIAYNNDNSHGYLNVTYPACGFFQVSELNKNVLGTDKVEYSYSYGRKKILNAENYIKTRFTFLNLSMYQQNLLKALCNCENLKINGVAYYLVSDFSEKNKSEENEICDLTAEFVQVSDPTFFATGAAETPSKIDQENLFMK